jgi:hypothetical protein
VARAIVKNIGRPKLELCVPWHYRLLDGLAALSPKLALRIVAAGSRT